MGKHRINKKIRETKNSKIIRINLSLVIGIITVFFVLLSSVASYKIATIGTEVLYSLGEELAGDIENDEDDAEEDIDEEEIEGNTDADINMDNSEVAIVAESDDNTTTENNENSDNSDIAVVAENYDDEVAVVDEEEDDDESSFDYNITVTEYTGDTLTATMDYTR